MWHMRNAKDANVPVLPGTSSTLSFWFLGLGLASEAFFKVAFASGLRSLECAEPCARLMFGHAASTAKTPPASLRSEVAETDFLWSFTIWAE